MKKTKTTISLSEETIAEVSAAATHLDRSLSWVMQEAWRLSRGRLAGMTNAPAQVALPAQKEPSREETPAS